MSNYKYYGKVSGKTVKGPISANSMNSAIGLVAKEFSLGDPSCETQAEVVQIYSGSNFVEITLSGSKSRRAARVECK